jgi:CRISPR-associated protein Cas2
VAVTVIIAYDISSDTSRARVAAALQQRGAVSSAVCSSAPSTWRPAGGPRPARRIIEPDTDSVYAFRQCATCWDSVHVLGQATVEGEPPFWAIL